MSFYLITKAGGKCTSNTETRNHIQRVLSAADVWVGGRGDDMEPRGQPERQRETEMGTDGKAL